jgi:glycosyltransferase involved in cell wall biosynthesis
MYEDSADRIRVFKNRMNRGKGFSIRKGIRHASGDLVVIQDADTEYDPREIPALLAPVLRGEADAVYGSRFLRARRPKGMGFLSLAANIVLTRLTNALYGLRLTDMETCYKVIRADLLKTLPLREDRFAFEPEVTAWLARKRARIVELPIGYSGRGRKEGKKIKARDFFYALVALARCRVQPMAGGAS